jgi:hypothetical protein
VLLGLPGKVGDEDGPCGSDNVWTGKNGEYEDEEGEKTKRTRRDGAQLNLCSRVSAFGFEGKNESMFEREETGKSAPRPAMMVGRKRLVPWTMTLMKA